VKSIGAHVSERVPCDSCETVTGTGPRQSRTSIVWAVPERLSALLLLVGASLVGGEPPGQPLRIEGAVYADGTGTPLAGAVVTALPVEPADRSTNLRLSAVSNEAGLFDMEVGSGAYTVSASVRGFRTETRTGVRAGDSLRLSLRRLPSITGVVSDPGGRPVGAAVVFLDGTGGARSGSTDRSGRFEFVELAPSSYRIMAHAPGLAPSRWEVVAVADGEARVRLLLRPGFRVAGTAVDAHKRPLTARGSLIDLDGAAPPPGLARTLQIEGGSSGAFVLAGVPPGRHVLLVLARGHRPTRVPVHVRSRNVELGEILLEAGLAVRGRVLDGSAEPVADCEVTAKRGDQPVAKDVTETDGTFLLGGLDEGEYPLVAACGEGTAARVARAGGEVVTLVLQHRGEVSGEVADETGGPVLAFTVALGVEGDARAATGVPEPVSGHGGRFSLGDVPEGSYSLRVVAAGFTGTRISTVRVSAGRNTDIGRLTLRRGFTVVGNVVDGLGNPVGGAQVGPATASGLSWDAARSLTDEAGHFELAGLPAGAVDIVARHPDYAGGRVAGVEVGGDEQPPAIEIVLTSGGRLEGRLASVRGQARGGASVVVQGLGSRASPGGAGWRSPVGSDGAFAFEHVPAGSVRVAAHYGSDPDGAANGPQASATVVDGGTTWVDLLDRAIALGGLVTRNGEPLAGAQVLVSPVDALPEPLAPGAPSPAGELPRRTALTGPDGSYALLLDSPGTYAVHVSDPGGRWRLPPRRVEVLDADSQILDLPFSGTRVSGSVIDRASQQPVFGARVSAMARGVVGSTSTFSDQAGRFELFLDPGPYRMRASREGESEVSVDLVVTGREESRLRLELSRGGVLRGRVVDPRGRPLSGMIIAAIRAADGARGATVLSGEGGAFEVKVPSLSGCNLLGVFSGSTPPLFLFRGGLEPTEPASPSPEYRAVPGVSVRLQVQDAVGAGLPDAQVYYSRIDGVLVPAIGTTRTDAQGRAELFVPPGLVDLRVLKSGREKTFRLQIGAVEGSQTYTVTL